MEISHLGMTVDELVSYLKHSSVATLLVEGKGDEFILRAVEESLDLNDLDILSVGGKGTLDPIYNRRNEFIGKNIVFLRDRDEYIAANIPPSMSDYVFTNGYSIENDILDEGILGQLAGGATLNDKVVMFSDWFRYALSEYLSSGSAKISTDVSSILGPGGYTQEAIADMAGTLDPRCAALLSSECWAWIRGKSLLRVVHSFFQDNGVRYSKDQIVDLCLRLGSKVGLIRIREEIHSRIS